MGRVQRVPAPSPCMLQCCCRTMQKHHRCLRCSQRADRCSCTISCVWPRRHCTGQVSAGATARWVTVSKGILWHMGVPRTQTHTTGKPPSRQHAQCATQARSHQSCRIGSWLHLPTCIWHTCPCPLAVQSHCTRNTTSATGRAAHNQEKNKTALLTVPTNDTHAALWRPQACTTPFHDHVSSHSKGHIWTTAHLQTVSCCPDTLDLLSAVHMSRLCLRDSQRWGLHSITPAELLPTGYSCQAGVLLSEAAPGELVPNVGSIACQPAARHQ
jgi:hypothetical protein